MIATSEKMRVRVCESTYELRIRSKKMVSQPISIVAKSALKVACWGKRFQKRGEHLVLIYH